MQIFTPCMWNIFGTYFSNFSYANVYTSRWYACASCLNPNMLAARSQSENVRAHCKIQIEIFCLFRPRTTRGLGAQEEGIQQLPNLGAREGVSFQPLLMSTKAHRDR